MTPGSMINTAGMVAAPFGPTVGKTWSGKSSKTQESFSGTTYKKKTTTTKTSASVNVNTGTLIQTGTGLLGNAVDQAE